MIQKIQSFQLFTEKENLTYKYMRDSFFHANGPTPFLMRKVSRTGEIVQEVRGIDESTAGFILEQLLVNKQKVEIEYFSYSTSFQEKLNK